ncbi:MAG: amidohydrolase family protein [Granulosicoccus sp.]
MQWIRHQRLLTPAEALAGVTRNAARALGMSDTGMIRSGMPADISVWNAEQPSELAYRIGANPLYQRILGGQTDIKSRRALILCTKINTSMADDSFFTLKFALTFLRHYLPQGNNACKQKEINYEKFKIHHRHFSCYRPTDIDNHGRDRKYR